jgi:hypothetical protein
MAFRLQTMHRANRHAVQYIKVILMPQDDTQMSARIMPVEAGHKIQLPMEWATELGLERIALLEKTKAGILVRPCTSLSWDEIFAEKLLMSAFPLAIDLAEVSGDDLVL